MPSCSAERPTTIPGCLPPSTRFFDDPEPTPTRTEVVGAMVDYADRVLREDPVLAWGTLHAACGPLFNGRPGARRWRRTLAENAFTSGADPRLLPKPFLRRP